MMCICYKTVWICEGDIQMRYSQKRVRLIKDVLHLELRRHKWVHRLIQEEPFDLCSGPFLWTGKREAVYVTFVCDVLSHNRDSDWVRLIIFRMRTLLQFDVEKGRRKTYVKHWTPNFLVRIIPYCMAPGTNLVLFEIKENVKNSVKNSLKWIKEIFRNEWKNRRRYSSWMKTFQLYHSFNPTAILHWYWYFSNDMPHGRFLPKLTQINFDIPLDFYERAKVWSWKEYLKENVSVRNWSNNSAAHFGWRLFVQVVFKIREQLVQDDDYVSILVNR